VPKHPEDPGIAVRGLKDLTQGVVAALFSIDAEAAVDWVKGNVSTDYHQWPPISNFARVVRNAIVHGGTININSETSPVVTWRSPDIQLPGRRDTHS
jgi:hypothetical protein